jgi:glycosyltransferase involved in cell wall biosynthesis
MKVLMVNMYYYPNMIGGCEHSVKLLAESLTDSIEKIGVVTLDGKSKDTVTEEVINGVHIYRIYSKSIYRRRILNDKRHIFDKMQNGIHSIINVNANKEIKEIITSFMPDVIHTNNLVSMSYWLWKYAKSKGIPVVHTLRDYWLLDPTTRLGGSNKCLGFLFRLYSIRTSKQLCGAITAPSQRTLDIFSEYGYFENIKKRRIVNSISLDMALLRQCQIEKTKRKNEKIKYIYAGYLSENKGVKFLVDSFVKAELGDATLTICGEGPLMDYIKEFSDDCNIYLTGKLSQQELFKYFKECDVMVVPSLWEEPFGRIVIEAAQFALPTISSDKGGLPETVKTIAFGDCYDSRSEEQLVDTLRRYNNREYIVSVIEQGPKNLSYYSIEYQVEAFIKLYLEVMEGK